MLPGDLRVEEREDPRIVEPADAVIRVTATCICGSDPDQRRATKVLLTL